MHVGNVQHIIFRYFIETPAGVVRVERLLLHKGDANNVLSTTIAYRIGYRESDIVYRNTLVYRSGPSNYICTTIKYGTPQAYIFLSYGRSIVPYRGSWTPQTPLISNTASITD